MSLVVLLGGARSGKSALAVDLARSWPGPVAFVATAEPRDEEMAERAAAHRAERPPHWQTVEEPVELRQALSRLAPDTCAVVDCLSLWVSNLLERGWRAAAVEDEAAAAAALAAARPARTVAVSNEVGLGIVPMTPLGRAYRDVLGRVNTAWAAAAASSALVVAGRVLALDDAERALGELRSA